MRAEALFLGYPAGLTPPSIGVTARRYAATRDKLPLWKLEPREVRAFALTK